MINKKIEANFRESIAVKEKTLLSNHRLIGRAADAIIKVFKKNKKILFFGNGGSAADSQHIAAEFIGRFQLERKSLPAIALTTDTSILTALGNDYNFDIIFARQIEGLGQKGDIAFGISTSGNSRNVIAGIKKANAMGLKTISLTGHGGGELARVSQMSMIVPSNNTARIQESHLCILHTLCQLVEESLFSKKSR